jgi:Mad3/BUB1 homology region 1
MYDPSSCQALFRKDPAIHLSLCARRFIKWTQDTSTKADLQVVLEACTKAIGSTQERYHNDSRYLRVWIQYVSVCMQS